MTTANAAGESPRPAAADSVGERLRAWSVVAVGFALAALPVFGSVGSTSFFTPAQAMAPLLVTLYIVVFGAYSDSNRVFNFLHTVTGRVSVAGYLGVATLDPTSHATEVVNTLTSQFDVVVELREADDGSREVRAVGHPGSPRTWQPF